MTVRARRVRFADAGEAAALAAFLGRLLRWDRAAAVRLKTRGPLLAAFGQPAAFRVLAVRTARLAEVDGGPASGDTAPERPPGLDLTVSAGELLEELDDTAGTATVPAPVTGPPWAGVLPPSGGWQRSQDLPWREMVAAAGAVVAEFRQRTEALPPEQRTRAALDALAEELWSRRYGATELPLRAVHAAHALGFLRPPPSADEAGGAPAPGDDTGGGTPPATLALLTAGPWLRLRTGYGSVVLRRPGETPGLSLTPLR